LLDKEGKLLVYALTDEIDDWLQSLIPNPLNSLGERVLILPSKVDEVPIAASLSDVDDLAADWTDVAVDEEVCLYSSIVLLL